MAPPAGFNSTMQLPKRQLKKIIVLVEFVIYGGLRTLYFSFSSYSLIVRLYRNHRVCLCTHTPVFLTTSRPRKRHLFFLPLSKLLVDSIDSIVNFTLANDSKKLAL